MRSKEFFLAVLILAISTTWTFSFARESWSLIDVDLTKLYEVYVKAYCDHRDERLLFISMNGKMLVVDGENRFSVDIPLNEILYG